jgi:FtsH-binding integral membrane protein
MNHQFGTYGGSLSTPTRQNAVLRNTYWLLALSLIPTMIGAVIGTNLDFSFLRASPMIGSLVIIGILYGWMYAIERNSESGLGVGLLLGFTFFMGLLLGPLLQHTLGFSNGAQLIMMAAGGTAASFFGLAAYATTTKRNLEGMGRFLMVGGIVIMLAVLANIFFQSPILHLVVVGAFVIFSAMMIAWQLNAIVQGGETNYVSATLSLYVSVYNLFTSLLQLLGIFGGDRD